VRGREEKEYKDEDRERMRNVSEEVKREGLMELKKEKRM